MGILHASVQESLAQQRQVRQELLEISSLKERELSQVEEQIYNLTVCTLSCSHTHTYYTYIHAYTYIHTYIHTYCIVLQ